MKIYDVRQISKEKIKEKNIDESVINLLLEKVLGMSHQEILINNILELDEEEKCQYFSFLYKYLENKEPIQYILGYTYFYKRKFCVNKNVLIPRFETEELVYNALKIINQNNYKNIVDIGSGSGNIAITLKKEKEDLNVIGLDISSQALITSKQNALFLNADVKFYQSDLLSYLIDNNLKVDMIVSNPPYIAEDDPEVDEIVKNNEPHLALYAIDNGLYNYKKIIDDSLKVLNNNGSIIFEIGYKQGNDLINYIKNNHPYFDYKLIKDIDQKDRILLLKL